jgi:hypothetical protein
MSSPHENPLRGGASACLPDTIGSVLPVVINLEEGGKDEEKRERRMLKEILTAKS